MRKRAVLGSVVSSAAVLVVGWQIGAHDTATTALSDSAPVSAGSSSAGSSSAGSPAKASTSPAVPTPTPTSTPTATATPAPAQTAGPATPATSAATPSAAAAAPAASAAAPAPAAAPAADQQFTGSLVNTRFGTIQVQITVNSGRVTDVTALKLTDDGGRSVQISARAAPILRSEVLAAQSANVASVSGATYTSDGYLKSVQSALDQAGL
ncbi:hypothetical protein BH09ACT6_BH09ACT6_07270 [soil metagenome]